MNRLTRWIGRLGSRGPSSPKVDQPRTPPGMRIYAVGDIHGRLDLLDRLHRDIRADMAAHPGRELVVIYLGDYIDRGPDGRGVLEALSGAAARDAVLGATTVHLRGNHEQAMLDFMDHAAGAAAWLEFGGVQTLASYGVETLHPDEPQAVETMARALAAAVPGHHFRFLWSLKTFAVLGGYMFVHAGIRPGVPPDRQALEDLLFIREPFLSYQKRHPHMVVHGHHVVDQPDVRPNRIGIDTGAFATGMLTCLVLDGAERALITT